MADDVRERQLVEAESLEAIFGDDFSAQGQWREEPCEISFSITLSPSLAVRCSLPPDYPEESHLIADVLWSGAGSVPQLRARLAEYLASLPLGEEMAYNVVTWCQDNFADGAMDELPDDSEPAVPPSADTSQVTATSGAPGGATLPSSSYFRAEALGEGACGSVMHVYDEDGQEWAAKLFESAEDGSVDTTTLREIGLLRGLRNAGPSHPNIVALADMATINGELCMIMSSYKCSLRDALLGGALSAAKGSQVCVASGLLSAVAFLHACKTMHRDIKPGNIMLNDEMSPVLIDFSLAKIEHANELGDERPPRTAKERRRKARGKACVKEGERSEQHSGGVGTPLYMAPEVSACEMYGAQADMWSVGVVLLEVFDSDFCKKLELCEKEKAAYSLVAETVAQLGSKPIPSLLRGLLEVNPAARLTSATALERFRTAVPNVAALDILPVQLCSSGSSICKAGGQALSEATQSELQFWITSFRCSGRVQRYAEAYARKSALARARPLFAVILAGKLHETDTDAFPFFDLEELAECAYDEDEELAANLEGLEEFLNAEKLILGELDYLLY